MPLPRLAGLFTALGGLLLAGGGIAFGLLTLDSLRPSSLYKAHYVTAPCLERAASLVAGALEAAARARPGWLAALPDQSRGHVTQASGPERLRGILSSCERS